MESQVDRAVGVQDDMEVKPESATVQEGHDSFDTYKAAGKVSVLVIQAMFCRNRDGC